MATWRWVTWERPAAQSPEARARSSASSSPPAGWVCPAANASEQFGGEQFVGADARCVVVDERGDHDLVGAGFFREGPELLCERLRCAREQVAGAAGEGSVARLDAERRRSS